MCIRIKLNFQRITFRSLSVSGDRRKNVCHFKTGISPKFWNQFHCITRYWSPWGMVSVKCAQKCNEQLIIIYLIYTNLRHSIFQIWLVSAGEWPILKATLVNLRMRWTKWKNFAKEYRRARCRAQRQESKCVGILGIFSYCLIQVFCACYIVHAQRRFKAEIDKLGLPVKKYRFGRTISL